MTVTSLMRLTLGPAATRDLVDEILRHDLPGTASYPGNEGTEVLFSTDDPAGLYLMTRWASLEDHNAYSAWRRTAEGATRLPEIVSGPPTFQTLTSHMTF